MRNIYIHDNEFSWVVVNMKSQSMVIPQNRKPHAWISLSQCFIPLALLWLLVTVLVVSRLLEWAHAGHIWKTILNTGKKTKHNSCRAQWSGARLGNRDIVPRWWRHAVILGSRIAVSAPRTSNVYHGFGSRGPPASFGTRDLCLLLGMSKYVSDRARYF